MKRSFLIALCSLLIGTYTIKAQIIGDRFGSSSPVAERMKANKNFDKSKMQTPEKRAIKQVERMDEKLNLSDLQEKSIYAIVLNTNQKARALHSKVKGNGAGMDESIRAERKAIMQESHKAIINVLDKEQAVTFQRYFTRHMMNKRGKHMNANPQLNQDIKMKKRSQMQIED